MVLGFCEYFLSMVANENKGGAKQIQLQRNIKCDLKNIEMQIKNTQMHNFSVDFLFFGKLLIEKNSSPKKKCSSVYSTVVQYHWWPLGKSDLRQRAGASSSSYNTPMV